MWCTLKKTLRLPRVLAAVTLPQYPDRRGRKRSTCFLPSVVGTKDDSVREGLVVVLVYRDYQFTVVR